MAEIINTKITANADFSGLLGQIRTAITELSALQKQFGSTSTVLSKNIKTANADFSAILGSTGQFTTQFAVVSRDVDKFGRNLDAGRLKLRDYYRTWQDYHRNSNSMVKELAKQQVALQQAILQPLGRNARGQMQFAVNIPTGIDELKNKTSLANKELSIMNKVMQDGSLQLINWGKNTQWAGRQLTVGLTVPIAAFGKAAADAFRMADQELTRLTKVYGGLAATSSQELQKVRSDVTQAAKEISAGYGVSFRETISLAADIAATGQQGQDLLKSLKETTRLAVLGEVDRQEAMKATLAIQNAFKQNTDQLAESINFLNAVENQTSTTLQDLVEAIPKAGPIIEGLGGSVQDLALYLTAMKEGGVDAASAANGLKSAFGSLINPTKVAKAMFNDFGINLEEIVNSNVGNLTQTILALQSALDTLSPLQKQQALEQLFGKYQFARMGALFDNLGRQGSQTLQVLDLMAASTQQIGEIADRELTMVTESASGRYRRAIEGLRADLATVGEGFLDIATKIINVADGVINFFNKLPEPVRKFLTLLGGATAVTGPIIMLTGVFANFIGYVFKGLSHLRSFFSGAKGFKLLTPDMIAAEAAAESFGQTLYSDAAAATALKSALDSLRQSIVALNSTTPESVSRVIPGLRPMGATAGMPSGMGGSGTIMPGANLAHFIAQARMTPQEFENQTFFHSTPYLGSINQGWGQRPQTIGVPGTPMVEGLTSLKGQSTLVDPTQYARYASMMTVMAGKTKKQLDDAIALLQTTGRLPAEFLNEFDDIFPAVEKIALNAGNAAKEVTTKASRGIITAEQAVIQIEAANRAMLAELESMALSRGITPASLRMVPGTNQQIISRSRPGAKPTYNMKSAFRENRGGRYTGPIAGETGVPLDPGSYQFRNMGGDIFYNDGDQVPGPNINADVVPAMLTPGEFVIRRSIAQQDPDGMRMLNDGKAAIVPMYNAGGSIQRYWQGGLSTFLNVMSARRASRLLREFSAYSSKIGGLRAPRVGSSQSGPSPLHTAEEGVSIPYGLLSSRRSPAYTDPKLNLAAYGITPVGPNQVLIHGSVPAFEARTRGLQISGSSPVIPSSRFDEFGINYSGSRQELAAASNIFIKGPSKFNTSLRHGTATREKWTPVTGEDMTSLLLFLREKKVPPNVANMYANKAAKLLNEMISKKEGPFGEKEFGKMLNRSIVRTLASSERPQMTRRHNFFGSDAHSRNLGLSETEYNRGGSVRGRSGTVSRNKTRRFAMGGMLQRNPIGFNLGGMVPGIQFLNKGSLVAQWQGKIGRNLTEMEKSALRSGNPAKREAMIALLEREMNTAANNIAVAEKTRGENVPGRTRGSGTRGAGFTANQLTGTQITTPVIPTMPDFSMGALTGTSGMGSQMSTMALAGVKQMRQSIISMNDAMTKSYISLTNRATDALTKIESGLKKSAAAAKTAAVNTKNYLAGFKDLSRMRERPLAAGEMIPGTDMTAQSNEWRKLLTTRAGFLPPTRAGETRRSAIGQRLQNYGTGGGMGASLAGMGLMTAGMGVQGPAGTAMQAGGMALSMAPMFLPQIGKAIKGMTSLGAIVFKAVRFLKMLSIPGAILTVVALLGKKLLEIKKNAEELGEANRASFGLTEKQAKQAGVQVTSFSDRLKAAKDQADAFRASGLAAYNENTKTGFKGLTLSIKELKDAIKDAKENMPDLVKQFNNINPENVNQLAQTMKADFIAGGLSAEEATNKVFAIIKASEKANLAVGAIGNEGFASISDKATAAAAKVRITAKEMSSVNSNSQEAAVGITSTVNALLEAEKAAIGTKDATGKIITAQQALEQQLGTINDTQGANVNLTTSQIIEVKKIDKELGNVLTTSDNLSSVYAKSKLLLAGMGKEVANLDAATAVSLAKYVTSVETASQSVVKSQTGPFGPLAKAVDSFSKKWSNASKNTQKIAQQNEESYKKQAEAIQKTIDKINEEADARRKALELAQKEQDFKTNIALADIEYRNAVANGNQEAAAAAQIRIQQLARQRQEEIAIQAIEDERQRKIKTQQAELEKINERKIAQDKKVAAMQEGAAKQQQKASQAQMYMGVFSQALQARSLGTIGEKEFQGQMEIAMKGIESLKDKDLLAAAKAMIPKLENTEENRRAANLQGFEGAAMAQFGSTALSAVQKQAQKNFSDGASDIKTAAEDFMTAATIFATGKVPKENSVPNKPDYQGNKDARRNPPSVLPERPKAGTYDPVNKVIFDENGQPISIIYNKKEADRLINKYKINIPKMKGGGRIVGPGTGTSDSIPIMASNGEYVVSAGAVAKVGVPYLDSINKMAKGGYINPSMSSNMSVPAYRMGGAVYSVPKNRVGYAYGGMVSSSNSEPTILNFIFQGELSPSMENKLKSDIVGIINNDTRLSNIKIGSDRKFRA